VQPFLSFSAATFSTSMTGAIIVALAVNNPALSGRVVTLRRIVGSYQTALFLQAPYLLYKSAGLAAGGTALVHTPDRTSQPGASAIVLGSTAGDLGVATAIVPVAGLRIQRDCAQGNAAAFQPIDMDGIDESIQPGESFYVETFALAGDNVQLTAYLTEHLGLG